MTTSTMRFLLACSIAVALGAHAEEPPAGAAPSVPQAVKALDHLKVKPNAGSYSWSAGPYRYDPAGNVITIGNEYFLYDRVNRLTAATIRSQDRSGYQTETYTYDVYGNLTQRSRPISDMVGSSKIYGAWVGTQMPSGNKVLVFGDNMKTHQIVNLSTTARTDIPASLNLPLPKGYDGAIGVFTGYAKIAVGADGKPVSRALVMFRELAENHHRTEKLQQYLASHQNAMQRETILRQQQSLLSQYTLGSGGPNVVTLKP